MKNFNVALYKNGKIKRLSVRNRYIVPFEFDFSDVSFESICKKIDEHEDDPYLFLDNSKNENNWKWVRKSLETESEQDLYQHIIYEFSLKDHSYDDKIEKMGCYWHYTCSDKEEFNFKLKCLFQKRYDDSLAYDLTITDMGLYVFRSGIGFIWYEVDADDRIKSNSNSLITFQNSFKELARVNTSKFSLWIESCNLKVPDKYKDSSYVPFLLGNWIAERLSFLNVKYQAKRNNNYSSLLKLKDYASLLPTYCPDKAILFTYVVFERDEDWTMDRDAVNTAYYLTNGYKDSYEMSNIRLEEMAYPFNNVLWSASQEGAGYFVWADDINSEFFKNNQYNKIMNDYFLLYIRALYQSFSLLKYTDHLSNLLPNDLNDYIEVNDNTEALSDCISKINTEVNLFMVKSIVTSVSHVQNQNDFSNYVCDRLKIEDEVNSVIAGLAALSKLQQKAVERKENQNREKIEKREKRADNILQTGLGLMAFFAGFSAITDLYSLISGIRDNPLSGIDYRIFVIFLIAFGAVTAIAFVMFVVAIYNLYIASKDSKKNK